MDNYFIFECEDCFEKLKYIEDNSVRLVLTDIPYGIGFENTHSLERKWNDKFTNDEYSEFIRKLLTELKRIIPEDGNIWLFCGISKLSDIFQVAKEVGLYVNLKDWKSLHRQKGRGSKNKPKSQREEIIHLTKSEKFLFKNNSDLFSYKENTTNVMNCYTGETDRPKFNVNDKVFCFKMPYYLSTTEKQIHSCQKSVLLLYALIMNYSNEPDTVLDPFAGSCSCGIAAKLANRNFIGYEFDKNTFDAANEWLNKFNYDSYRSSFLK